MYILKTALSYILFEDSYMVVCLQRIYIVTFAIWNILLVLCVILMQAVAWVEWSKFNCLLGSWENIEKLVAIYETELDYLSCAWSNLMWSHTYINKLTNKNTQTYTKSIMTTWGFYQDSEMKLKHVPNAAYFKSAHSHIWRICIFVNCWSTMNKIYIYIYVHKKRQRETIQMEKRYRDCENATMQYTQQEFLDT